MGQGVGLQGSRGSRGRLQGPRGQEAKGWACIVHSQVLGISPQSCTETDFEMKTSNFVLFLLISVVSVHFRAIYDETIRCQA